ncbi:acyltransferase [Candidatus Nitrospira bockiana]
MDRLAAVFSHVTGALRVLAEKLLRGCVHPGLRAACLRALGAQIGRGVRVDEVRLINVHLAGGFRGLSIGDDSVIAAGVLIDLTGPVYIGRHCSIDSGVHILSHSDPGSMIGSRLAAAFPPSRKGVRLGDHVWVGPGTTILNEAVIGDRTVIGAGSLVLGAIPAGVFAEGHPARSVRILDPTSSEAGRLIFTA